MKRLRLGLATLLIVSVVLIGSGPALAAPPAQETTLTIWTGLPELEPFYELCAERYAEEHPGFEVEILSTTLREFEQKLATAIPTGTGPDIFDVGRYIAVKYITSGHLPENPPDVDEYLKSGAWDEFVVNYMIAEDGKSYGLPLMDGSKASLFYNKDMFAEAELDPGKPPATFEEVLEYARKLAVYDEDGNLIRSGHSLRLSGQGSGITEKFRFVLHNAGGDLVVQTPEGKWHNGFDNEAGRKALKYYVDSVQKYKVDSPEVMHDAEAFVAEQTAMLLREAWVIGEIKSKNPDLNYGVAPMPAWERHDTLLQPWGIYVSATVEDPEVAWDFLKFICSKENAEDLVRMTGWLSERVDVDWDKLIGETPQFEAFLRPPEDLGYYADPTFPEFDEIQTKVADMLVEAYINPDLLDNDEAIAAAIHEMAEVTDGILEKAGLYGGEEE